MCHILASNRIWAFKFFVGVGGVGGDPHACVHPCMHMHICACMTDVHGCKQEGNKGISGILAPIFGTIGVPVALLWSICVILHVFYHVC